MTSVVIYPGPQQGYLLDRVAFRITACLFACALLVAVWIILQSRQRRTAIAISVPAVAVLSCYLWFQPILVPTHLQKLFQAKARIGFATTTASSHTLDGHRYLFSDTRVPGSLIPHQATLDANRVLGVDDDGFYLWNASKLGGVITRLPQSANNCLLTQDGSVIVFSGDLPWNKDGKQNVTLSRLPGDNLGAIEPFASALEFSGPASFSVSGDGRRTLVAEVGFGKRVYRVIDQFAGTIWERNVPTTPGASVFAKPKYATSISSDGTHVAIADATDVLFCNVDSFRYLPCISGDIRCIAADRIVVSKDDALFVGKYEMNLYHLRSGVWRHTHRARSPVGRFIGLAGTPEGGIAWCSSGAVAAYDNRKVMQAANVAADRQFMRVRDDAFTVMNRAASERRTVGYADTSASESSIANGVAYKVHPGYTFFGMPSVRPIRTWPRKDYVLRNVAARQSPLEVFHAERPDEIDLLTPYQLVNAELELRIGSVDGTEHPWLNDHLIMVRVPAASTTASSETIAIWDVLERREVQRMTMSQGRQVPAGQTTTHIVNMCWSGTTGTIDLWDAATGLQVSRLRTPANGPTGIEIPCCLSISPTERNIAMLVEVWPYVSTAKSQVGLYIWSTKSGNSELPIRTDVRLDLEYFATAQPIIAWSPTEENIILKDRDWFLVNVPTCRTDFSEVLAFTHVKGMKWTPKFDHPPAGDLLLSFTDKLVRVTDRRSGEVLIDDLFVEDIDDASWISENEILVRSSNGRERRLSVLRNQ